MTSGQRCSCSPARSPSCFSSPARTSPICCSRAQPRATASSPSAPRSAPAAAGSSASCWPRAWSCRCAGGFGGLLLAWWGLGFLRAVVAERLPIQRLELVGIDADRARVHVRRVGRLRLDLRRRPGADRVRNEPHRLVSRKAAGRGSAARGNRTRGAFVVVEVALALVLLVGAGLLVRSFVRVLKQDPGFDPSRTVTMRLSLPQARYGAEGQRAAFLDRFFTEVDGAARRRRRRSDLLPAAHGARRGNVDGDCWQTDPAEGSGAGH